MATIRRFEELEIWQLARIQCQEIDKLIQDTKLVQDFVLRDQINRSSGSVMDNIAEGFDRFTKKDFRHFLVMARGSNAELRSQLYRILDKGYLSSEKANMIMKTCTHLSVKITNLINYLSNSIYTTKPSSENQMKEPEEMYGLEHYELPDEFKQA